MIKLYISLIKLINQILNLNVTKSDDMIKFVESLLMKTESFYVDNIESSVNSINNLF